MHTQMINKIILLFDNPSTKQKITVKIMYTLIIQHMRLASNLFNCFIVLVLLRIYFQTVTMLTIAVVCNIELFSMKYNCLSWEGNLLKILLVLLQNKNNKFNKTTFIFLINVSNTKLSCYAIAKKLANI